MPFSASANVDKPVEVQPIPNLDDCIGPNYSIASRLWNIVHWYDIRNNITNTLNKFHADMNSVLTKPELINCKYETSHPYHYFRGNTVIHAILNYPNSETTDVYIEATKWALSKGYDLSIKVDNPSGPGAGHHGKTAAEMAKGLLRIYSHLKNSDAPAFTTGITGREAYIMYKKLVELLEPPPAPATKPCAEVDGQTPPANEYCIVAENIQESFKARLVVPGFDGYEHKTTAVSSGVGFRKDWKSTIIFTCRAPAGQSCEGLPYADDPLGPGIDADNFELYVRCGNTINLLDVDSIDGGKSETIDVIEVTNEYPYSRNCTAKSSQPFTLSIKTTRLAQ